MEIVEGRSSGNLEQIPVERAMLVAVRIYAQTFAGKQLRNAVHPGLSVLGTLD